MLISLPFERRNWAKPNRYILTEAFLCLSQQLPAQTAKRVLPRYHGRLSEESFPLLLHVESPSLTWIMTPLDVGEDISPGLGSGPVVHPIHPLTFEHTEEALGCRIVGVPTALMLQMIWWLSRNRWYASEVN